MIRIALLAALLAGCNTILGLEEAEREVPDADHDGVEDSRDNCPQEPNPEQLDTDHDRKGDACDSCPLALPTRDADGDGLDDACDPCSLGPSHDEDADTIFDACDLCPGIADPAQDDKDGDGIGDVCDPSVFVPSERLVFDAFAPARSSWSSAVPWVRTEADDSLSPPPGTTGATTLVNPILPLEGASPTVVAGFRFTGAPGATFSVGLRGGGGDLECGVVCATTCVLYVHSPSGATTEHMAAIPSGVVTLTIHVTAGSFEPDFVSCTLEGEIRASMGMTDLLGFNLPAPVISATPGIDVRWIDAFQ